LSWYGYSILFPIFNNALNAGLASLAKTTLWQREKQNVKTGNMSSKQYFVVIGLLLIELSTLEIVGK